MAFNKAATPNAMPALDKEQVNLITTSNFPIFTVAEKEMEYRVDLFNRLTTTCFKKCVENRYKEPDLNMGETSCIDRCVSKYWQVTSMVGQMLSSQGQQGM
ncbi:protein transporter tim10 [Ranunculus cassubicifolius]